MADETSASFEMPAVDNPYSEAMDCPICPMLATDRDDALNNFQSLAESYDALVANSSAEHQRMSQLLQALSTNVTRLDEEKEQDRRTIDYWKGQFERREDDYARLYAQCEDIKEQYRDCASALAAEQRHHARLAEEKDAWSLTSQVIYLEQQRWQAMAEDLWEELQEWHHSDGRLIRGGGRCPNTLDDSCTCHRILADKWDELTHAGEYADEDTAT